MPGPLPKPAAQRRRRNTISTAAVIRADGKPSLAPLKKLMPDVAWHPMTEAWWADLAGSPMTAEYDSTDAHGLLILASLEQDFWTAESPTARLEAAREIRLQRAEFGLSPLARRRLQWTIANAEDATARTAARRTKTPAKKRVDPRTKEI